MPTLCTAPGGETIAKGDAVCVTSFDTANSRPIAKRATRENLARSKTVFGVAKDDATGGSVFVLVAGDVAENTVTNLGSGGSRIVVTNTDIQNLDLENPDIPEEQQCRLKRIDSPIPTPESFVIGTCDEEGNLIIQPRHSSYETGFSKGHNVRAYGAVPDWNYQTKTGTDNLTAFNKAIQAAANEYINSVDPKVKIPVKIVAEGWFYLSNTLHLPRGIILEGCGRGDVTHSPGTMLVFPANVTGIRVHHPNDLDIPAGLPIFGVGGEFSQIRNLTVYCHQSRGESPFPETNAFPPNGFVGHGIHASIVCFIRDVTVNNFAENGIWIASGSPENPGNAVGTHIINTNSTQNGAHGFHFVGVDSTVGLIEMCYANLNWGNGFRDEGGTGNTYVACYCQGNLGERDTGHSKESDPLGYSKDRRNHDFYVANDAINRSVFYGCYSEASVDHIYAPAGAIGGLLSEGTFPPAPAVPADDPNINDYFKLSNGFSLSSGGVVGIGPLITQYKHDLNSPRIEIGGPPIGFGNNTQIPHAFSFIARKAGVFMDFLRLLYRPILRESFHDWWEWQSSSIYRPIMRFPTLQSDARHPAPWMTSGLFIGRDDISNNPIHMTAAPSPPTIQYDGILPQRYEVGDIVWNSNPSVGGPIGQVCITSGTPETPISPTFSTFGEVTNIGKSTSYNSNTLLTVTDRYVTVTATGTMTLPASNRDGQTHSIKSQAGTPTRTGVTTTVDTEDGLKIDGQDSVSIAPGENSTFRFSAATNEWEIR
jgi:hypothetical protein